jgi:hypothetical protein
LVLGDQLDVVCKRKKIAQKGIELIRACCLRGYMYGLTAYRHYSQFPLGAMIYVDVTEAQWKWNTGVPAGGHRSLEDGRSVEGDDGSACSARDLLGQDAHTF